MKSVVLHKQNSIGIEDFPISETLGKDDVRIAIRYVGICGSDVHYYTLGRIGDFVVRQPMILGHEASGIIIEKGANVRHLEIGDPVCMEPGIPDPASRASRLGKYNIDPSVRFWATPPVHGCLRENVVHPATYTYKVPENVSLPEAAMVEPMAIGVYASMRAGIQPGDTALILGAGTIGLCSVLAALAAGCSRVIVSDLLQPKLDLAESFGEVIPVNPKSRDLGGVVSEITQGWGVDVIFEASGSPSVYSSMFDYLRPGGRIVLIGMPPEEAGINIAKAQAKEALLIPIFRYAHVFPRTLALMASGNLPVSSMISRTFAFDESIEAFRLAAEQRPEIVKVQIRMDGNIRGS